MATQKKYSNNVDTGARHHYDVYELIGDEAFHVAPFTQESDALRVADALAALMLVEKDFHKIPADFAPRFIVRARPTVAHKIYETNAKQLDREVKSFGMFMEALISDTYEALDEVHATKTSVGDDQPKIKAKKKSKVAH